MVDRFILKLHEDSDPMKPGSVLGKKSFENSAKNCLKFVAILLSLLLRVGAVLYFVF